ncbi:MAG: hypothetical protein CVU85_05560 [Firmicutes bacterium HGW-Firmicutes-10]|nr:MAG: hypothetical protein CVU85_05560 [Firmicutes bacterium HGW-Firmicutes-10]
MKGIVMSSALIIFLMGLIVSISLYISFESDRFQVHQAVKSALRSTMLHCLQVRCDPQASIDKFASDVHWITKRFSPVSIDLLGFNDDPLLIRVRVMAKGGTLDMFDLICEETMIEEGSDEEN